MPKPAMHTLAALNRGAFLISVDEQLAELVKAVDECRKSGVLTIKLTVKPASRNMMHITGELAVKAPKAMPADCVMFPTPDGSLEVDDPSQGRLPLTSVEGPDQSQQPIKSVA